MSTTAAIAKPFAFRYPTACLPEPQPLDQARRRSGAAQAWLTRLLAHEERAAGGASHRALVEALPDGAFVARHGRFVFANPMLLQLLGYASDEFLGLPVAAVVAPTSLQAWNTLCGRVEMGGASQQTIMLMGCDGAAVAMQVRVGPLEGVGLLGTVRLIDTAAPEHQTSNEAARSRAPHALFTPQPLHAEHRNARMAAELHTALAQGQFQLHYQPIVDLASGRVRKAEALLRWNHPTLGLVSPADFIALAEQTRLILQIGDWVFREAARAVQLFRPHYDPGFQISLNKSPVQFAHGGQYPAQWLAYLAELGLPGDALALEITEGLLLDSSEDTAQTLRQYRASGIQVAIDDFGTGYSALAYLRKFDIDYLKIDRAFVSQLTPASHDLALTEAIVVMAHKLGLRVVAEGVETTAQCALLREVGCDFAQGFLFDQAQPLEVFEYRLQMQMAGDSFSAWAGLSPLGITPDQRRTAPDRHAHRAGA